MSSQADKLLNTMSEEDIATYIANSSEEEHIVIDTDRNIIVPKSLERIAVQFDNHIETVTFDCPRYWDEHDFSKMIVYINYRNAAGNLGRCIADNVRVDENDPSIIHFDWLIRGNITIKDGKIAFIVCIMDGTEDHWNSELCTDMYVSEGLDCSALTGEDYYEANPDILTQLLLLNKVTMERASVYVGSGEMPEWANVQIDPEGDMESIPFSVTNYAWDTITSGTFTVPEKEEGAVANPIVIDISSATLEELRKYKVIFALVSGASILNSSGNVSMAFGGETGGTTNVATFRNSMWSHSIMLIFMDSQHYSAIVVPKSVTSKISGLTPIITASSNIDIGAVDLSSVDEASWLKFTCSNATATGKTLAYTVIGISKEMPASQLTVSSSYLNNVTLMDRRTGDTYNLYVDNSDLNMEKVESEG